MIATGAKLGPYEIQSALGAGGMGEVYRARDTRLDRTVAIKILASHLSSSPELKQRFEREARTVSSLNHAHICQLFDVGSQDGTDFLVMEFLEGETLAERLRKGALSLNELLKIGTEIAEALEVAHRAGIIHRDLKPGNIMLTKSGAKLMDFGLAKPAALGAAASGSAPLLSAARTASGPSPMSPLTTAGSIVGTIQYMSPEQIEGKEADARSDIFAFGAVLYEMATGKRAFEGKSQISVASAILEKDPEPISTIKPLTPPQFEHVVRRALEKVPDDRWQTASDIRGELKWIRESGSQILPAANLSSSARRRKSHLWLFATSALATLLVVLIAVSVYFGSSNAEPLMIANILPPEKSTFEFSGNSAGPPVISPDGKTIAFVAATADGNQSLWIRRLDSLTPQELPGTEQATFPFWSPDSRSLGFFRNGLLTIDINGGAPLMICPVFNGRGGSWTKDGKILFANINSGILQVPAEGGTSTPFTKLDSPAHTSERWPLMLPDDKHFLYLAINHDPNLSSNDAIYWASRDGKETRMVMRSMSDAVYANGYLLFARGDELMAQKFNPATGTLSGEAELLAKGAINDPITWKLAVSAAQNGLIVVGRAGTIQAETQLTWLDREGKQTGKIPVNVTNATVVRIAPDGNHVALGIDQGNQDLWIVDLARGIRTRFTFGPVVNYWPAWSPDGKWIAFASSRNTRTDIYRKRSDGSGSEELLLKDDKNNFPMSWSPDGKNLLYVVGTPGIDLKMWCLPLTGDRKPFQLQPDAGKQQWMPRFSPDGKWISYSSDVSGEPEVYVTPFPPREEKWQVSTNGGVDSFWDKSGEQITVIDQNGNLASVPVSFQNDTPQFGTPQRLFSFDYKVGAPLLDESPDGKRFLGIVSQGGSQSLVMMNHWKAALKK